MEQPVNILIIEDEAKMRRLLRKFLEQANYLVDGAASGWEGLEQFGRKRYHLVILDVMLPGLDGMEVCRRIREKHRTPIIMLTAKGEEVDRVLGLELGADDYVTKPFSPRELVARVKALLRRSFYHREEEPEVFRRGKLVVDFAARKVTIADREVHLTTKEFDLLAYLCRHAGKVCSRHELLNSIWGYDFYGVARTVDSHIRNLREKLAAAEDFTIVTVWGIGYKVEVKS